MDDIRNTATEKIDIDHHDETFRDRDVMGENDASKEAMHWAELTPEELEIEGKLRKKIDLAIMPLIMLVYLLNCELPPPAHRVDKGIRVRSRSGSISRFIIFMCFFLLSSTRCFGLEPNCHA